MGNLCFLLLHIFSGGHHSTLTQSYHQQETTVVWRQETFVVTQLLLVGNPWQPYPNFLLLRCFTTVLHTLNTSQLTCWLAGSVRNHGSATPVTWNVNASQHSSQRVDIATMHGAQTFAATSLHLQTLRQTCSRHSSHSDGDLLPCSQSSSC